MAKKKPTVADIRANKGKFQYTMMRTETWDELAAAEAAGIDMCSVPPELLAQKKFREIAPSIFAVPGVSLFDNSGPTDDFLRWGYKMLSHGADAVYCAASLQTVTRMADEGIPVIGHTGLIPSKATWTGGFKAVGKNAESAKQVYDLVKRYEDTGAFGVEIEVVPSEVTAEIAKHTNLFLVSMGAGVGGDCQYLFADDVLGQNTGHIPRHAKIYRNFAKEFERLQMERVAAFSEFVADVKSGVYPEEKHLVGISKIEFDKFIKLLPQN